MASFSRLKSIIGERISEGENQKIVSGITTQPGPYLAIYGQGHQEQLTQGLNATGVAIIHSEKDGYAGMISSVPEYVYYADTDRMLHIPQGSPERAKFLADYVKAGADISTGGGATGAPLSAEEAMACIRALPEGVQDMPFPAPPPAASPFSKAAQQLDWKDQPHR